MGLGEADTRAKLIDPALHTRGWTEDLIRREETAGAVPPLWEQRRLIAALDERTVNAERAKGAMAQQLTATNTLPAALLRRAFSGEL